MYFSPCVKLLLYSLKQKRRSRLKCRNQNRSKKSRENPFLLSSTVDETSRSRRTKIRRDQSAASRMVANPLDVLKSSKASKMSRKKEMEILSINDLNVALHNFVYKDDKLAFNKCLLHNLEEAHHKIGKHSGASKFEEEDISLKLREMMEARITQYPSVRCPSIDLIDFSGTCQGKVLQFANQTSISVHSTISEELM